MISSCANRASALKLAESIRADVAGLTFADHPEIRVTIRTGVAVFPEDGNTVEELLLNADATVHPARRESAHRVKATG